MEFVLNTFKIVVVVGGYQVYGIAGVLDKGVLGADVQRGARLGFASSVSELLPSSPLLQWS